MGGRRRAGGQRGAALLLSAALLLGAAVAQGPGSPPAGTPATGTSTEAISTGGTSVGATSSAGASTGGVSASSTGGTSTDAVSASGTSVNGASTEGVSTAAGSTSGVSGAATSAAGTSTGGDSTAQISTAGISAGLPDLPAFTPPSVAAPAAGDDNGGEVELTRTGKDGKERRIQVVKSSSDDSTGIFAICSPQEGEPDSSPTEFVASDRSAGGVQVTVDKNLIQAPLALVTKQQGGDGHIEMSTGQAAYVPDDQIDTASKDRLTSCGVRNVPKTTQDTVLVTQGKTHLKGARLVYDEQDGVARIDGPVAFTREQDAGDPVDGSATRIEVSVDDERTTLVGNVQLVQGDRTSKADRVDYDDAANTAILHGTPDAPAETRTPTEQLRAQTIRYFLDTGEAVVEDDKGGITGTFQDGTDTQGSSATGTSAGGPPQPPIDRPGSRPGS